MLSLSCAFPMTLVSAFSRRVRKPFMNRFVLLPIRLHGGGRPTHFLSVQKDVTYLRFTEVPPEKWRHGLISIVALL